MTARREPNERKVPDLDPEDWDEALRWRPVAYQTLRGFLEHALGRAVRYEGSFGQPNFQWLIGGGVAYGVDPVSIAQDLEYRALEATAVAVHDYDSEKAGDKPISTNFLRKVILRDLRDEFGRWLSTSGSRNTVSYGSTVVPILPDGVEEPSYLDPHDEEPNDGLSAEDRAKLQAALGALTSKEAWALRMSAEGDSGAVIAEKLGFKTPEAAYKFIRQAREKGQKAYEASNG